MSSDPKDKDWSQFAGSMPLEGVVHPTGEAKKSLLERIRNAFEKVKRNAR